MPLRRTLSENPLVAAQHSVSHGGTGARGHGGTEMDENEIGTAIAPFIRTSDSTTRSA